MWNKALLLFGVSDISGVVRLEMSLANKALKSAPAPVGAKQFQNGPQDRAGSPMVFRSSCSSTAAALVGLLTDVRGHMVQYLLVGGSLCIFYLLVLSLSEQIRFDLAYGSASAVEIAVVSLYVARMVRRLTGLVTAAVPALIHAWMFVLLQREDFVLLSGTIGLLLALVTVMYVTRNVDWYRIGTPSQAAQQPAA